MDISGNTLPQTTLIYPPFTYTSYNQYTNVLLIDNATPSYQTFVDSANNDTFSIVYSKDCLGTELLELLRNRFTSINRIGFVFTSPGNQSSTFLDNMPLFHTDNYIEPYSNNVELIVSIIREFSISNIDFLACDTLNDSVWCNYYDFLSQSTGVIVGASDNKTGNLKYGGDWILESTSQDIETVYFTKSIEYYQYLLDTTPLAPTIDTGNTKSLTVGNISVYFTDIVNNYTNNISYVYYLYDPSSTMYYITF